MQRVKIISMKMHLKKKLLVLIKKKKNYKLTNEEKQN
jgi:hypothetical protein